MSNPHRSISRGYPYDPLRAGSFVVFSESVPPWFLQRGLVPWERVPQWSVPHGHPGQGAPMVPLDMIPLWSPRRFAPPQRKVCLYGLLREGSPMVSSKRGPHGPLGIDSRMVSLGSPDGPPREASPMSPWTRFSYGPLREGSHGLRREWSSAPPPSRVPLISSGTVPLL